MLIEHRGHAPAVDPTAYVAPTAVLCGDVRVGPEARVLAVGDPARILPPSEHEQIWMVQKELDFPGTVYGVSREASSRERMERQAAWFAAHRGDRVL